MDRKKKKNLLLQRYFKRPSLRVISRGGIILSREGSGIIFNVDIFRACLEKGARSTNIKLDRTEVNFWEAFLSAPIRKFLKPAA